MTHDGIPAERPEAPPSPASIEAEQDADRAEGRRLQAETQRRRQALAERRGVAPEELTATEVAACIAVAEGQSAYEEKWLAQMGYLKADADRERAQEQNR